MRGKGVTLRRDLLVWRDDTQALTFVGFTPDRVIGFRQYRIYEQTEILNDATIDPDIITVTEISLR